MSDGYVHGYMEREAERLTDQAGVLVELLHGGTAYPPGARVLEAGCGVGAQTVTLARRSPEALITSIDVSEESLAVARRRVADAEIGNVELLRADISELPFGPGSFDHVFVCFVLEHLADPVAALRALREVVRPGGTITVIEGDHGSAYFHPPSAAADAAIECLVELQRRAGGDGLIGRRIEPLLAEAGLADVRVRPLAVYADETLPEVVDGFTLRTFTAMVEGVGEEAVAAGLLDEEAFGAGARDLRRTAEPGGVFNYTFFKAVATSPGDPEEAR